MKFLKFCNLKGNLPYHTVVMDRLHGALKLTHDVINALWLRTYHTHSPTRPGACAHTHACTHARTDTHAHTRTHTHTHVHTLKYKHTQNTYYIVPQYSIIEHHIIITVLQCSTEYYEAIISQNATAVPVAEWIRHWFLEPGIGMRICSWAYNKYKTVHSLAGNRTPVSCVTDRDTHHYTTKDWWP